MYTASYTKENISRRLLRRSAELWGLNESKIDQFDPLVRLLIEACSVEFEKIGQEIEGTELRLMTRLAEILSPQIQNSPQPCAAIAQARPVEPLGWTERENQFVCKRPNVRKGEPNELFFAPAGRYPLVNAAVACYATPAGLYAVEKGARVLMANTRPHAGAEQVLWIGLEVDPGVTSWNGFRFFIDWINDLRGYDYREFLPKTAWEANSRALSMSAGLQEDADQQVLLYNDNFITVGSDEVWEKGKLETAFYPSAFEQQFDSRTLQMLKKPLTWIKAKWPSSFPAAGFENMTVAINAFPVLNMQLHKFTYRLQPGLNGIALPSSDAFVTVNSVINQKNQAYAPSGKATYSEEETVSTYTVRHQGVGRFDERNAKAVLYHLTELLKDEVTAFNAVGEDFLASLLREISQNMARIEQKLGVKKASETTAQPFLVIKGEKSPDVLFISYWTTTSETANGIPAGTKMQSYSGSGVSSADTILLTRTAGGKPKPEETEYVQQLRKNLITGNKLVTLEDIRAFCSGEMGDRLAGVEVRSGFVPGNLPGQGFVRSLIVDLKPAVHVINDSEWRDACQLLQLKIQRRSSGMYPVKVLSTK